MFERYSTYNENYWQKQTRKSLQEKFDVFSKLVEYNHDFHNIVTRYRNIGLPVLDSMNQQYTISRTFKQVNEDYLLFFSSIPTFIVLEYLGVVVIAYKWFPYAQWKVTTFQKTDLKYLFPSGIPQTEKQLSRWVSYLGYTALKQQRDNALKYLEQVKQKQQVINLLRQGNVEQVVIDKVFQNL